MEQVSAVNNRWLSATSEVAEKKAEAEDKSGEREELNVEVESEQTNFSNEAGNIVDQNTTGVQQSLSSRMTVVNDMENGANGGDDCDMYLPPYILGDPEAISPEKREGHFRMYMCLVIAAAVIGAIGAVLGVTLTNEEIPQSLPYRATLGIRENLARVVGDELLDDDKSPYHKALNWIMFADPAAITPDNTRFIQRYILAYLYYATSMKKPWEGGCAPATDKEAPCEFEVMSLSGDTSRNFTKTGFRWLSSVDECTWAGIDCDRSSQVRRIEISGNGMTGTFPDGILSLPFLQYLGLWVSELDGRLPESLWKYKYFHDIEVSSNAFTGTIPETWFQSRFLRVLSLASNQLSGTISEELSKWKDICTLVLDDNLFEGAIPNEIGNLKSMFFFAANANNLNGTIPRTIGSIPYIQNLHLSRNKIGGTIPTEIGKCSHLRSVFFHDNLLTGTIPDELWMAKDLFLVFLEKNNLNGTIGGQITTLSNLWELKIQDNQLTGNIPVRLGRTGVSLIEASGNNFTGTVPDQICDLVEAGQLEDLELDCAVPPGGGVPEIVCPCCTLCCSPNGNECYPTS